MYSIAFAVGDVALVCAIVWLLYTEEYQFVCHLPESSLQEFLHIPTNTIIISNTQTAHVNKIKYYQIWEHQQ